MKRLAWAALLASACGSSAAPPTDGVHASGPHAALAEGAFLPLGVSGDHIVDASGRQVVVRGLEHHALQDVDYQGREVEPGDYALIASWGFTALRMAISWSRIEPSPGHYDSAYLDQIGQALDAAHAAGLGVVLEWHQDLWGRCSVSATSGLESSANGAPDWTCPASIAPSPTAYRALFDRLWKNDGGLMDAFLAAWGAVIDRFGAHPAVIGYDILNEPSGALDHPAFERDEYLPALRKIVPALRARGAKGLLFFDASVVRNETFQMFAEPIADLDPALVYAPHLYSGWIRLYILNQPPDPTAKQQDFQAAADQAQAFGVPWWNGEWGVNNDLPSAPDDLALHVGLEEQYRVGSSYWAFEQATPGQGNSSISGAQSVLDEHRQVREPIVDKLSRPYPVATPGTLAALHYDFAKRALSVSLDAGGSTAPLVLYAPTRALGSRVCLSVAGPGGWSWDAEADKQRVLVRLPAGHFDVELAPCGG